jgi:hypothetical protein
VDVDLSLLPSPAWDDARRDSTCLETNLAPTALVVFGVRWGLRYRNPGSCAASICPSFHRSHLSDGRYRGEGVLGKNKPRLSGISDTNTSNTRGVRPPLPRHLRWAPLVKLAVSASDLGFLFVLDAPRLLNLALSRLVCGYAYGVVYVYEATRQIRCHGHQHCLFLLEFSTCAL